MAHTVKVTMTIPEISKVDTCYEIKENGKKLGTLRISKGGIDYLPKGHSTNSIKKSWSKLHDLLTKALLLPVFISLLVSCTEKRHYSYSETLPEEIKLSKRKLAELELTPGYEEEKAATRSNIALSELMCLDALLNQFQADYTNDNGKTPSEEVIKDFKKEIKYDSLKAEFDWIVQANKLE